MERPSDPLTGVKCFAIGGRMIETRQRCLGMTDEERRWRAQFLKDQILSHDEPREVPEYYKATTNIFRRLWKTPFWKFQLFLRPLVGEQKAFYIRHYVGKTTAMLLILYTGVYYLKYNTGDWTYPGPDMYIPRERMYPDEPNYPNYPKKSVEEYYDKGFSSSIFAKKITGPPEIPSPPAVMTREGLKIN